MKEGPRPLLFLFYFTAEPQDDQLLHYLHQKVLVHHRPAAVQKMVPTVPLYTLSLGVFVTVTETVFLSWGFYGCEKIQ